MPEPVIFGPDGAPANAPAAGEMMQVPKEVFGRLVAERNSLAQQCQTLFNQLQETNGHVRRFYFTAGLNTHKDVLGMSAGGRDNLITAAFAFADACWQREVALRELERAERQAAAQAAAAGPASKPE